MYVKIIPIELSNGTNQKKQYDLDPYSKTIKGIALRQGTIPNQTLDTINVKIRNQVLADVFPAELLTCQTGYVEPDKRFFTLIPKEENITGIKLEVEYKTLILENKTVDLMLLIEENEGFKTAHRG